MAFFKDRLDAGRKLAKNFQNMQTAQIYLYSDFRGVEFLWLWSCKGTECKNGRFVVRKLGVPGNEELAMGAIASDNIIVLNEDVVRSFQISKQVIDAVAARELRELERRERIFRGKRPKPSISGSTVILIDDGLQLVQLWAQLFQLLKLEIRLK